MQKAEKTNGLSASAEQNLPVPPAGHAGEDLPASLQRSATFQQQLEQRGVRLAPLHGGETPAGGDPFLFQQPGRRQGEADSAPAGPFAELAFMGGAQPATTTKTGTLRGWESWA